MKEKEILSLTAVQLGKKIKEREVTCREALEAVFAQIGRREPELNCCVTLEEEKAFKQAEEVQRGIDEGILTGPLAGGPGAAHNHMSVSYRHLTLPTKRVVGRSGVLAGVRKQRGGGVWGWDQDE